MKTVTVEKAFLPHRLRRTAYCIRKEDLGQCAVVMSKAFHDDPAIRYLLGGTTIGQNDWRYFLTVLKAVYGKCIMLSSSSSINDLLILFPPELKSVPAFGFLKSGGIGLLRFFGPSLFWRSMRYENNCQKIREKLTVPGTWYCMCFVVLPEKQGQGYGSRLIRPTLDIFNHIGVSLYLETHKKLNRLIYKHLGFQEVDISKIPGTETAQYAFLFDCDENIYPASIKSCS